MLRRTTHECALQWPVRRTPAEHVYDTVATISVSSKNKPLRRQKLTIFFAITRQARSFARAKLLTIMSLCEIVTYIFLQFHIIGVVPKRLEGRNLNRDSWRLRGIQICTRALYCMSAFLIRVRVAHSKCNCKATLYTLAAYLFLCSERTANRRMEALQGNEWMVHTFFFYSEVTLTSLRNLNIPYTLWCIAHLQTLYGHFWGVAKGDLD